MKRSAPRASVRSMVKKHQVELRLERDTELLVHLSCILFLHRLAKEARLKAFENRTSVIKPAHVKAVAKMVLKNFKG
ncbi:centromere protein W [Discoglossus pictus]